MMKTITQRIVPGRGGYYLSGMILLLMSIFIPQKAYSQCLTNAQDGCDNTSPIVLQLDASDVFTLRIFEDFYDNDPVGCDPANFMVQVTDLTGDSLIVDASPMDPDFVYNNACKYVGQNMKAELFYTDGNTMIPVCERKVILLPEITCTNATFYCNHPVFEENMDEQVLPIQFGCDNYDPTNLDVRISSEYWDDMSTMDTLFRVWEIGVNNNKSVITCTDTILREAIPIADIIIPADTIISCEAWNGVSPDPAVTGVPYFIVNPESPQPDTIYLDEGQVTHCVNVQYMDDVGIPLDCELGSYARTWQVRTDAGTVEGIQMITIIDSVGPEGEFLFTAVDSIETNIGDSVMNLPVFQVSTGSHGCESDGNLPILYASDPCSGVHGVSAQVTDGNGQVHSLTNGGPFMGFDQGKYLVTYTASDSCWNQSTFYIWVEVVDLVNPVISLSTEYNITLSDEVTWLNLEDFAAHHISDNCGLEIVVGRRVGDHATACGADDSTSIVGMYRQKYADWLESDGWNCTELVDVDSGWMDKIPFCCADLGSEIMIELMAIDQSCNVTRNMTVVVPISKGGATIFERLPDVSLACEAWTEHYEGLIYGDTLPNNLNIDSLDKYFGTYLPFTPGNNVEIGSIVVEDVDCYVEEGLMVKEESLFETHNGLFRSSCAGELTQEAELVYDDGCNTFTITRRFLINGNVMAVQEISTEIRCPFEPELFDYPASADTMITISDSSILKDPSYWVGNRFNLTTEGPEYKGADCRVIATGYVDKLLDDMSSNNPNEAYAVIMRTWCMADWCSSDLGPDWKSSIGQDGIITWTQNIKIFIDPDNPDVSIEKPDPDKVEDEVVVPPVSKDVVQIEGRIRTEDALNVNNVTVEVQTSNHNDEMVTNESGSFEMKVDQGSRVKIRPVKKGDLGNGLSTLDLILIQRHLLRKKLITSPYKLIAADANNDQRLTPADVLFLRRVILNKMQGLEEMTSWKFVDANYTFINQKASYSEDYPTVLDIERLSDNLKSEFIAVKLGDVNQSVNVSRSSSRATHPVTAVKVQDQFVKSGDVVDIPLKIMEAVNLTGVQFALHFDNQTLEVLDVRGDQLDLSPEEWTIQDGMVKMSWTDINSLALKKGDQMVTVRVRAKRNVNLRDVVSFNTGAIEPEIYDEADVVRGLGLTFSNAHEEVFAVHQNRPNPVQGEAVIDYELDQETTVHLQIHDVTGKLIHTQKSAGIKGLNQFRIQAGELQSGVLYYTITDGLHSATRKMVVIK